MKTLEPIKIMGDKILFKDMSNVQLQAHIRLTAQDSSQVFFLDHAHIRMLERGINDFEVLVCLRSGVIQRPSRRMKKSNEVRASMEHFGSARNLCVVVSLSEEAPDLLVVTAFTRKR